MHLEVPVLLAEYAFRSREDLEDYLEVLESIPDYLKVWENMKRKRPPQGFL